MANPPVESISGGARVAFERPDGGTLLVRLSGSWRLKAATPSVEAVGRELVTPPLPRAIAFEASGLGAWDSSLLTYLIALSELARERGVAVSRDGLPDGVQRLIALAEAVPEREGARSGQVDSAVLDRIGETTIATVSSMRDMVSFLGEVTITFGKLITGRARFRRSDLALLIQQAGLEALPIVSLVAFLLGAILAFVGAVQLQTFGATIFVADLVGVAMVRDMGALITAIVMAGRSGAAYAAQLGSMTVNQEIDALRTMAISPLEFLVLPRVIALCLMIPLLTIFANALGIFGGMIVGVTMLDLSFTSYFQQTAGAVNVSHLLGGLVKAFTYGIIIALSGCLRGMQSGKSSSAVGDAATAAVVMAIGLIISAAGVFAVLFYVLGI